MSWLSTHKPHSKSVRDYFRQLLDYEDSHTRIRLLDCVVGCRAAYLAVETVEKIGTPVRQVMAGVCAIEHIRDPKGNNFRYNLMDETMNPGLYKAPRRILEQLTPTTDPESMKWRERAWAWVGERERAGYRPLQPGDVVESPRPLDFSDGRRRSLFVISSNDPYTWRRTRGYSVEDGQEVDLRYIHRALARIDLEPQLRPEAEGPVAVRSFMLPEGEEVHLAVSMARPAAAPVRARLLAKSEDLERLTEQVDRINRAYQERQYSQWQQNAMEPTL